MFKSNKEKEYHNLIDPKMISKRNTKRKISEKRNMNYQMKLYVTMASGMIRFQLQFDKCRGQCYDGASNILGKKTGIALKILITPTVMVTLFHSL